MIINNSSGTPLIEIEVDDTSYRYRSLMRDNLLTLEFSLATHVEFPIGAYCEFEGETYSLISLANVTVRHRRNYEYRLMMYSDMERTKNYIIFNPVEGDHRIKFELTATPLEHLNLIVDNLCNREGAIWSVGAWIDAAPMTLSYSQTTCWDALVQLANAFNTEFEISGRRISLGKVEYNKTSPLALSYGRGNGLRPGITRLDAQMPIERVYVQGGNRNIGLDNYDSKTLHLPKAVTVLFDGVDFSDTDGIAIQTNLDGTEAHLAGASDYAVEAALDLSDIYPHREGEVSGLVFEYKKEFYNSIEALNAANPDLTQEDWYEVYVYFWDQSLELLPDLDFDALKMGQDPLTVIFQNGNLAGREFNVTFRKEPLTKKVTDEQTGETTEVAVVPANSFELEHATIDGTDMPAPNYLPVPTGTEVVTYGVFYCSLPQEYINAGENKQGAEWDMLREACRFLYENKDPKVSYRGELDPIYAKTNWLAIGGKIKCGGFVRFTDPSVQVSPIDVRITGVRQYVNNPYAPVIEFGNEAIKPSMTNVIHTIDAKEAKIESMIASVRRFSGRSFADAKETAQMLIDLGLENFTEAISPIVIQTMQLIAGDESLQFQFIRSLSDDTVVGDPVQPWDNDTKKLIINHSYIKHLTLGITDITAAGSRDPSEYKRWEMERYESPVLADPDKRYYIYAQVSATSQTGHYTLSEEPLDMERYTTEGGERVLEGWNLLVGILTSERDGNRSYGPVYGFTEILPGQITTEVIRSSDGQAFFDLSQRIFQLGDKFYYSPTGGLVIKNGLVVTGSGEEVVLGGWCGEWDSTRIYALGDEVWWQAPDGTVSTYRYVYETPSSGNLPSNLNYWIYMAKGVVGPSGQNGQDGDDGEGIYDVVTAWAIGLNSTTPPSSGWQSSRPSPEAGKYIWTRTTTSYTGSRPDDVVYSAQYCPQDGTNGTNGDDGIPGPSSPYRGEYSSSEIYYATARRCDVVYYNGYWYQAIYDPDEGDRVFSNIAPGNTSYWTRFEGNFSNVATGLLFAAEAIIDKLGVRILETDTASSGNPRILIRDNIMSMYDSSNAEKMRVSGNSLSSAASSQYATMNGRTIISTGTVYNPDFASGVHYEGTSATVSFSGIGNGATLILPAITIHTNALVNNVSSGSSAILSFTGGWIVDGVRRTFDTANTITLTPSSRNVSGTISVSETRVALSAGTHTIGLYGTIDGGGDLICDSGSFYIEYNSNVASGETYPANLTVVYTDQITEVAANGFQVRFGSQQMFRAEKSGNDIYFTMQADNVGLEISTANGIRLRTGGTWKTVSIDSNGFVTAT